MKNDDTPVYREAIIEAKRRTKRGSRDRQILEDMDRETRPLNIVNGAISANKIVAYSVPMSGQGHSPESTQEVQR